MTIPPTRNHRQLAAWINATGLVDKDKREVVATVTEHRVSTDRKAGRQRVPGKGRASLRLEIRRKGAKPTWDGWCDPSILFRHESGETYRRHAEAVQWVKANLQEKP